jgi:hypothetical protein
VCRIWRWYFEEVIKCVDLESVKEYGMTIEEFAIIAKCNSTFAEIYRPDEDELLTDLKISNYLTSSVAYQYEAYEYENKYNAIRHDINNPVCKNMNTAIIKRFNLDFFRTAVFATTRRDNFHIVSNLSRKALNQTGDGHFTTITAFHAKSDSLLLLDSARFKYNSMWFTVSQIFDAMKRKDSTTDRLRGFLLCSKYH